MFQKKKKEVEPEQLSEKDIKNLKEKLVKDKKTEQTDDLSIKDLKISELLPQNYNNVIVTIFEGYHTLQLPSDMEKGKFKTWRKSAGGMFGRDVLAFSRGKKHGKYLLLKGKGERKIVRLIEDDELYLFKHLRLVKGIVKDKPYMLLRNLTDDEKLTGTVRYIKQNSEHEKLDETISVEPPLIEKDENDYDSPATSVSLFDE